MLLKELSQAPGVSGNEEEVRRIIKRELEQSNLNYRTDTLGNLLVSKEGRNNQGLPRILLSAHMDEVGLMVTAIEENGNLRFKKVGGIDDRVLVSKAVSIGHQQIPGVIGSKAVHLQKPEEKKKNYEVEQLFIDIGVKRKSDAEKYVKLGDYITFDTPFTKLGEGVYGGKAFDDRAGCLLLLELLKCQELPPFYGAFTVQEEVGLRGAQVAGYSVNPEVALSLETTTASDVPEMEEHQYVSSLGKGTVFSLKDASLVVDKDLLELLISTAQTNQLPFQFRNFTGGGTDAGPFSLAKEGAKAAVVSLPCRYIHSPFSILYERDLTTTKQLLIEFIKSLEKNPYINY